MVSIRATSQKFSGSETPLIESAVSVIFCCLCFLCSWYLCFLKIFWFLVVDIFPYKVLSVKSIYLHSVLTNSKWCCYKFSSSPWLIFLGYKPICIEVFLCFYFWGLLLFVSEKCSEYSWKYVLESCPWLWKTKLEFGKSVLTILHRSNLLHTLGFFFSKISSYHIF